MPVLFVLTRKRAIAAALATLLPPCTAPGASRPPNIVLVLADGVGYETPGANGGSSDATPVLDRLADEGMRFEHCHAQSLCTPTRVQMMTGQYNVRNDVRFGAMPGGARTFANLLRDAGYATCVAGKWQLGTDVDLPRQLGFAEACQWQHTRRPPRYTYAGLEIKGVSRDYVDGEYGPDLTCDDALDFIDRHASRPFLLYCPLMLAHGPYQPTPASPEWDPARRGEESGDDPRHFAEMVRCMDQIVGRMVARLEQRGLRERTLILSLVDTGTGRGISSRLGDRTIDGGKGRTTDAGMHVPLIVNGRGTVAPVVCADLVDSTDFLPTRAAAAGVAPPTNMLLDGRSFLPQPRGEPGRPGEWADSWYCPRPDKDPAVRECAGDRRFKLYRTGEFFDRTTDPEEERPISPVERTGDAAAADAVLPAALDQFAGIRPAAFVAERPDDGP